VHSNSVLYPFNKKKNSSHKGGGIFANGGNPDNAYNAYNGLTTYNEIKK